MNSCLSWILCEMHLLDRNEFLFGHKFIYFCTKTIQCKQQIFCWDITDWSPHLLYSTTNTQTTSKCYDEVASIMLHESGLNIGVPVFSPFLFPLYACNSTTNTQTTSKCYDEVASIMLHESGLNIGVPVFSPFLFPLYTCNMGSTAARKRGRNKFGYRALVELDMFPGVSYSCKITVELNEF